jgi:hypothetical protein
MGERSNLSTQTTLPAYELLPLLLCRGRPPCRFQARLSHSTSPTPFRRFS